MTAALVVPARAWENRTREIVSFNKETGEERAQATVRLSFNEEDGEAVMLATGYGDFAQYTDKRFQKRTRFRIEGYLKPLESEAFFYDKKDNVVGGFRYLYDYEKREVLFQQLKADKKIDYEKTYPLKGPTCDAINLLSFLEAFLPFHEKLLEADLYLISNEPKLYKVNIYYRGLEEVDLPSGKRTAKKVRLIGDMGPLTLVVAKFLPETHVWFTPRPPYRWLKYEGLEKGPESVNVEVVVE